MGLRVLACIGCCLACLPRAAAQAGGSPSATQADSSPPDTQPNGAPPLSAQGETMSPATSAAAPSDAPPSAAASPAPQLAAPPPAAVIAPAVSAPPPPAAHAPQRQGHDLERPPPGAADADEGHLSLRLSLGLQAALLGIGSDLSLRRPSFASFDIGYACTHWVLLLRAASWLSFGSYVSQFIGAGFSYLFSAAGNMFVTGALGIALHEGSNPQYDWGLQGLAAQLDLGQQWPISATSSLGVGAHFEIATHWLGTSSLTDFGMGLFVSAAYR